MDKSYLKKVNGLYDLLSANQPFEFNNGLLASHTVTKVDMGRPDIISLRYYGDHNLWWAILKANSIRYSFRASLVLRKSKYEQPTKYLVTDIYPGRVLRIPTITDINEYLNSYKRE